MRKIVQCSMAGVIAGALSACQTVQDPYTLMTQEVVVPLPAPVASARPPDSWEPVTAATGEIASVGALQNLVAAFPQSATVRRRLLNAHLQDDDSQRALSVAQVLVEDGYAFTPGSREFLRGLVQTGVVPPWLLLSEANEAPLVASTVVATIPAEVCLPEAALHDPAYDRMLVTSVVSRGLFVHDGEGEWRQVEIPGAGSLAGIALDERRGLVWLGSGVVEQTPDPDSAFRGMIALDRSTLEVRRRVAAPEGASISDIAVGPDGTVYGSDPLGGGVYVAAPQDAAMTALIPPGTFRSPQGLATRLDGRSLFVSDYSYGVAVIMLPSRQVYRLQTELPLLLDGVDGLWLHGNELVVVQNGINPHRIMALQLGTGPGTVVGARVIERAHPGWTEPLGGGITGNVLTYLGTGQWDRYGAGGTLNEGAEPLPAAIHQVDLVDSTMTLPE